MTDYRKLCAELVDALAPEVIGLDGYGPVAALLPKARAALAQPEPEGPTDEAWQEFIEQLQRIQHVAQGEGQGPRFDLIEFALLAWGRPTPQPADGEVAELVASLERMSIEADAAMQLSDSEVLGRAATILERLGPPQPIPVSERLPGPGDCDAEGKCWWGEPQIENSHDATWNFCTQSDAEEFCTWGTKCGWLPAHALPLPSQPS